MHIGFVDKDRFCRTALPVRLRKAEGGFKVSCSWFLVQRAGKFNCRRTPSDCRPRPLASPEVEFQDKCIRKLELQPSSLRLSKSRVGNESGKAVFGFSIVRSLLPRRKKARKKAEKRIWKSGLRGKGYLQIAKIDADLDAMFPAVLACHKHPPDGCDIIVCRTHNRAECLKSL